VPAGFRRKLRNRREARALPVLSVVVLLGSSIRSLEVIVVDDGSTHGTHDGVGHRARSPAVSGGSQERSQRRDLRCARGSSAAGAAARAAAFRAASMTEPTAAPASSAEM